jgi:3-hydroxyacyl-[acyl-carrier-protein] dehydratase
MEVRLKRMIRGMGIFEARALVDGQEVASCELMSARRAD